MASPRFSYFGLVAIFALGMTTGYFVFGSHRGTNEAIAQTVVVTTPSQWEYTSVSVDAISLQAKLTTLGIDGWEVISIESRDLVIDAGADGHMRASAQRFEVTAKRKRR